jgi:hypothetical protein
MEISYNCSVLDDTFKILDAFSVNIYKDNNLFIELGGKRYDFEDFKVDHLSNYICDRRNVACSYRYAVKLWKVNVDMKLINETSTRKDLFKVEMLSHKLFCSYLGTNRKNYDPEKIHIIIVIPGKCLQF